MSEHVQPTTVVVLPTRRLSRRQRSEALDGYLMLLPTILGVGLFFAVPLAILFAPRADSG